MIIDWEAAKSGKRLLRFPDGIARGCEVRYLAALNQNRYAVIVRESDGSERAITYRDNGTCMSSGPNLVQDPEVIEFKRWVNVYADDIVVRASEGIAQKNAEPESIAVAVPITIRITGDKVDIFGGTE